MSGKRKHSGKRSFGSKSVFLMLALVLVIGCTIGGTLAWLTANSGPVANTFVAGQIGDLELDENDTASTTYDATKKQYIVIPGMDITKSPKVTYTPTSADGTVPVDAYVFVKLTQDTTGTNKWVWNATASQYEIKNTSGTVVMSFEIDSNWTKLDGVDGVFYKEVAKTASKLEGVSIISGNKITVSSAITEKDVEAIATAADKLTFNAYAIQKDGVGTVNEAWTKVTTESTNS